MKLALYVQSVRPIQARSLSLSQSNGSGIAPAASRSVCTSPGTVARMVPAAADVEGIVSDDARSVQATPAALVSGRVSRAVGAADDVGVFTGQVSSQGWGPPRQAALCRRVVG